MPRKGYRSVTLSDNLIQKIDSIQEKDNIKFRSRSDVIKEAVGILEVGCNKE